MKKQDKLEAFVGCACVFGALGIAIYKAIKNGRAQRKALDEQFEKDMKEIDERSAERDQEFTEFMENLEKERKVEDERHAAAMKKHEEEMKRLERERKEAEEKHRENMKKLDDLDARCNERLNNVKDFDELIKAGNECVKDIQTISAEVFENYPKETTEDEGIYKHETRIVFKGKLAEMMEEKMKED